MRQSARHKLGWVGFTERVPMRVTVLACGKLTDRWGVTESPSGKGIPVVQAREHPLSSMSISYLSALLPSHYKVKTLAGRRMSPSLRIPGANRTNHVWVLRFPRREVDGFSLTTRINNTRSSSAPPAHTPPTPHPPSARTSLAQNNQGTSWGRTIWPLLSGQEWITHWGKDYGSLYEVYPIPGRRSVSKRVNCWRYKTKEKRVCKSMLTTGRLPVRRESV